MIKILAIGNSFSEDATAYLHQLAKAGGVDTKVVNLYIGGCDLETHWANCEGALPAYRYQCNGAMTDRMVSVKEMLTEGKWDMVTFQQASRDSGVMESYRPYLRNLSAYVKRHCPDAVQWIHQTWAYELDSEHEGFARYHNDQEEMYRALKSCYQAQAEEMGLPLIPTGDVLQALRECPHFYYELGGDSLCRDGVHLQLSYGRFAAAAVWYETLLGGDIRENPYMPPFHFIGDTMEPDFMQEISRKGQAVLQNPVVQGKLNRIRETVHASLSHGAG